MFSLTHHLLLLDVCVCVCVCVFDTLYLFVSNLTFQNWAISFICFAAFVTGKVAHSGFTRLIQYTGFLEFAGYIVRKLLQKYVLLFCFSSDFQTGTGYSLINL